MAQIDYETTRRRQWLAGEPKSYDDKRAAALAFLGERWLLHPANAPKRGRYSYGQPKRVRS
jgi:hypothetical protein